MIKVYAQGDYFTTPMWRKRMLEHAKAFATDTPWISNSENARVLLRLERSARAQARLKAWTHLGLIFSH